MWHSLEAEPLESAGQGGGVHRIGTDPRAAGVGGWFSPNFL